MYYLKYRELDLLPLSGRLKLNDMKTFHKIIHNKSALNLPSYITYFDGQSRLRSCHYDNLTLISSISPKVNMNYNKKCELNTAIPYSFSQFSNNYYYRAITFWNTLPYDVRKIEDPKQFEQSIIEIMWERSRPLLNQ